MIDKIIAYLAETSNRMLILWCYFIWYLVMIVHCLESDFSVWGTAIGISVLVGVALNLSTGGFSRERITNKPWEVFRLFLVPFCVSSFSATVKGKGFLLILAPDFVLNLKAFVTCCVFVGIVLFFRIITCRNRFLRINIMSEKANQ